MINIRNTFGQCEATTKKGKQCTYPVYETSMLDNDKIRLCSLHWHKENNNINGLQPYAQQKLKELKANQKK